MAAIKTYYENEAEYLYDLNKDNPMFDEQAFSEGGKDYLYLLSTYSNTSDKSKFNAFTYDNLDPSERMSYMAATIGLVDSETATNDEILTNYDTLASQNREQKTYDSLSGFSKFLTKTGAVLGNFFTEAYGTIEGLIDLGGSVVGQIAEWSGDTELTENIKNFIASDVTKVGKLRTDFAKTQHLSGLDKGFGNVIFQLSGALGQMTPMLLLPSLGGTIGLGTKASSLIAQAAYYGSIYGQSVESTFNIEGTDTSFLAANLYATGQTAAEFASEKIFGDVVFGKGIFNLTSLKARSAISNVLISMVTEGLEEGASEAFGYINTQIANKISGGQLKGLISDNLGEDIWQSIVVGGLLGGILTGGKVATTQRLTIDGKQLSKNASMLFNLDLAPQLEKYSKQASEVYKLKLKNPTEALDTTSNEYKAAAEKDAKTLKGIYKTANALGVLKDMIGETEFQKVSENVAQYFSQQQTAVQNYYLKYSLGDEAYNNITQKVTKEREYAANAFNSYNESKGSTIKVTPINYTTEEFGVLERAGKGSGKIFIPCKFGDSEGNITNTFYPDPNSNYVFVDIDKLSNENLQYIYEKSVELSLYDTLYKINESTIRSKTNDAFLKTLFPKKPGSTYSEEEKRQIVSKLMSDPKAAQTVLNCNKFFASQFIKNLNKTSKTINKNSKVGSIKYRTITNSLNLYKSIMATMAKTEEQFFILGEMFDVDPAELMEIANKDPKEYSQKYWASYKIDQSLMSASQQEAYNTLLNNRTAEEQVNKPIVESIEDFFYEEVFDPKFREYIKKETGVQNWAQAINTWLAKEGFYINPNTNTFESVYDLFKEFDLNTISQIDPILAEMYGLREDETLNREQIISKLMMYSLKLNSLKLTVQKLYNDEFIKDIDLKDDAKIIFIVNLTKTNVGAKYNAARNEIIVYLSPEDFMVTSEQALITKIYDYKKDLYVDLIHESIHVMSQSRNGLKGTNTASIRDSLSLEENKKVLEKLQSILNVDFPNVDNVQMLSYIVYRLTAGEIEASRLVSKNKIQDDILKTLEEKYQISSEFGTAFAKDFFKALDNGTIKGYGKFSEIEFKVVPSVVTTEEHIIDALAKDSGKIADAVIADKEIAENLYKEYREAVKEYVKNKSKENSEYLKDVILMLGDAVLESDADLNLDENFWKTYDKLKGVPTKTVSKTIEEPAQPKEVEESISEEEAKKKLIAETDISKESLKKIINKDNNYLLEHSSDLTEEQRQRLIDAQSVKNLYEKYSILEPMYVSVKDKLNKQRRAERAVSKTTTSEIDSVISAVNVLSTKEPTGDVLDKLSKIQNKYFKNAETQKFYEKTYGIDKIAELKTALSSLSDTRKKLRDKKRYALKKLSTLENKMTNEELEEYNELSKPTDSRKGYAVDYSEIQRDLNRITEMYDTVSSREDLKTIKEKPKHIISSTVAPYLYNPTTDETFETEKKKVDKKVKAFALDVAKTLGLKITNIKDNVGGYIMESGEHKGEKIEEVSYSFVFETEDIKSVDLFTCIMGDLVHENQLAVISCNYGTKNLGASATNETNSNGNELVIRVKSEKVALAAMRKVGLSEFSYDIKNKIVKCFVFDWQSDEKIKDTFNKINALIEELGDDFDGRETTKIQSRYLQQADRRNAYDEWLKTMEIRGEDGSVRDITAKESALIQKALNSVEYAISQNEKSSTRAISEEKDEVIPVEKIEEKAPVVEETQPVTEDIKKEEAIEPEDTFDKLLTDEVLKDYEQTRQDYINALDPDVRRVIISGSDTSFVGEDVKSEFKTGTFDTEQVHKKMSFSDYIDVNKNFALYVTEDNAVDVAKAIANAPTKGTIEQTVNAYMMTYLLNLSKDYSSETRSIIEKYAAPYISQAGALLKSWKDSINRATPIYTVAREMKSLYGVDCVVSEDVVNSVTDSMKNPKESIKKIEKEIKEIESLIVSANSLDLEELNARRKYLYAYRLALQKGDTNAIIQLEHEKLTSDFGEGSVEKLTKMEAAIAKDFIDQIAEKTENKKYKDMTPEEKEKFKKILFNKINNWRYFSMLSNPATLFRNVTGNALMSGIANISDGFDKVYEGMTKFKEGQFKYRATSDERAKVKEIIDSEYLNNDRIKYELSGNKYSPEYMTRVGKEVKAKIEGLPSVFGKWSDFIAKNLDKTDQRFVGRRYYKNLLNIFGANYSFIVDEIYSSYSGKFKAENLQDLINKIQESNYSKKETLIKALQGDVASVFEMMSPTTRYVLESKAFEQAAEQYFRNDNKVSKFLNNLSSKSKIASVAIGAITPFTRVATNMFRSFIRYSPLEWANTFKQYFTNKKMFSADYKGMVDPFAQAKLAKSAADATTGTILAISGIILAALGVLGFDDEDYMGLVIKIGDVKIRLSDLAPGATPIAFGAAMIADSKKDPSWSKRVLSVLYDQTLMGNFNNLLEYNTDSLGVLGDVAESYVTQYIPNIMRSLSKVIDPRKIKKSSNSVLRHFENIITTVPGVSLAYASQIDPYTGKPAARFGLGDGRLGELFNIFNPIQIRYAPKSEVEIEAETIGAKTAPSTGNISINEQSESLKGDDFENFAKIKGQYINDQLTILINSNEYKKMNTEEKKNAFEKVYSKATEIGKINYWTSKSNKNYYVFTDSEKLSQYSQYITNKSKLRYSKKWKGTRFIGG